jgi:hypothetical protein
MLELGLSVAAMTTVGGGGIAYGPELIGDPGFDNSGYWSKSAVVVSGSKALFNQPYASGAPTIYRNEAIYIQGRTYRYEFTISNYATGNVKVGLGWNVINFGDVHAANGTFSGTVVAADGSGASAAAGLFAFADFIGDIDNFSLKEVL